MSLKSVHHYLEVTTYNLITEVNVTFYYYNCIAIRGYNYTITAILIIHMQTMIFLIMMHTVLTYKEALKCYITEKL